jgi:hypothetical protein
VPVPVFGYLGVHHEIFNFDLAQSIDGVGYPPQERRYITLVLTGRVGLAEVLHGPRGYLAHPSSLPPEPPSSAANRVFAGSWFMDPQRQGPMTGLVSGWVRDGRMDVSFVRPG